MRQLPLIIIAVIIGVLLTTAVLLATGTIHLPGTNGNGNGNGNGHSKQAAFDPDGEFVEEADSGYVNVIISRVDVPAYTRITREHVVNPITLRPTVVQVPEDSVQSGDMTTFREIQGRVLARNKAKGYKFNEADFLPAGTREGVSAGVPPGARAVVVEAGRIQGSYALNLGDRFDLVTMTPEIEAMFPIGPDGKPIVSSPTALRRQLRDARMSPALVVSNGLVVRGVTARQEFFERRTGLVGGRTEVSTKPVEEITFAVDADEVGGTLKALTEGQMILAVARSGRIDEIDVNLPIEPIETKPVRPVMPEMASNQTTVVEQEDPEVKTVTPKVIETIIGNRVSQVFFTPEKDSDQ